MNLTQLQITKLIDYIPSHKRYLSTPAGTEDRQDRQQRLVLYADLLSPQGLKQMTELELGQVVSALWANQMWGNKGYLVDKLVQENGLPKLQTQLEALLWGKEPLAKRYDAFRKNMRGFGTAMLAEILAFVHPQQCGVWNDKARQALKALGFTPSIPFLNKSQLSGTEYQAFNDWVAAIVVELQRHGLTDMDALDANYFFFEVARTAKDTPATSEVIETTLPVKVEKANHSDLIEQVLAVGQALGFQTEKEKLVAKGAKVDVVWQARIANLGVVMYIFEVQSHGSIDSLILNLQRAQVNQSVQRLIVVASAADIARVRGEIATLPENFRRAVSYWETGEVMRAASLVSELNGIINKLDLVKSEFGT